MSDIIITINDIKEIYIKNRARYYHVNDFVNIKSNNVNENVNEKNSNNVINLLNQQIEYLKNEIDEKNIQIQKLHTIIDQQQKLELVEKTKENNKKGRE